MRRRPTRKQKHDSWGDRLAGAAASLFFSVPTAAFLWFALNKRLAFHPFPFHEPSVGLGWLIGAIVFLAAFAFLFPRRFTRLLGGTWHVLHRLTTGWW
ncbi:MAG: hypothetical protein CMN27_01185 [Salinisphaera sp.]|nr:hypothetical protein [Salinisphaera sp.]